MEHTKRLYKVFYRFGIRNAPTYTGTGAMEATFHFHASSIDEAIREADKLLAATVNGSFTVYAKEASCQS